MLSESRLPELLEACVFPSGMTTGGYVCFTME